MNSIARGPRPAVNISDELNNEVAKGKETSSSKVSTGVLQFVSIGGKVETNFKTSVDTVEEEVSSHLGYLVVEIL